MSTGKGEVTGQVEATMARVHAAVPSRSDVSLPRGSARSRSNGERLFPEDLYRNLRQARMIGGGLSVDGALGWRTPIIGQAWLLVRRRIHQEIRIYIDALTTQQSNLNTHLLRALVHIVETLDRLGLDSLVRRQEEQESTIAALRAEVQELHGRVDDLQARFDQALPLQRPNGAGARPESD
ncbi:MAG: hypothetical protein ACRDIY_05810 [Chloroflexota bacterium]